MRRSIAAILMTGLGLALLLYTATRTIDLVDLTLPGDSRVVGYLAVAGLDGGLIVWLLCFRYGSRGHWQRGISAMMIVVCLIGVAAATVADTVFNASKNGAVAAQKGYMLLAVILCVTAIIVLNVAAATAMHLTDPEALHASAEEDAKATITAATLQHIQSNAHSLAAELAPQLAQRWMSDMRAQHLGQQAAPRYASSNVVDSTAREIPPGAMVAASTTEAPAVEPSKPSRAKNP